MSLYTRKPTHIFLHWNLVSVIRRHLIKVLPAHVAEAKFVPVVPIHFVRQLSNLPSCVRVLTLQVPIDMVSHPQIFLPFGPLVAYLSPTPQWLAVGEVIVNPGCDRSGTKVLFMLYIMLRSAEGRVQPHGTYSSLGCRCSPQPISIITVYLAFTITQGRWVRVLPPWPLTFSRKSSAQSYVLNHPLLTHRFRRFMEMGASHFLPARHWLFPCL